jgi:hypothetical protein
MTFVALGHMARENLSPTGANKIELLGVFALELWNGRGGVFSAPTILGMGKGVKGMRRKESKPEGYKLTLLK